MKLNMSQLEANSFSSHCFNADQKILSFSQLIYLSDRVDLKVDLQSSEIFVLFNTPEFFDDNLLYSKILKKFMKKYNLKDQDFIVKNTTELVLKPDRAKWEKVKFHYDPKLGDISLSLR